MAELLLLEWFPGAFYGFIWGGLGHGIGLHWPLFTRGQCWYSFPAQFSDLPSPRHENVFLDFLVQISLQKDGCLSPSFADFDVNPPGFRWTRFFFWVIFTTTVITCNIFRVPCLHLAHWIILCVLIRVFYRRCMLVYHRLLNFLIGHDWTSLCGYLVFGTLANNLTWKWGKLLVAFKVMNNLLPFAGAALAPDLVSLSLSSSSRINLIDPCNISILLGAVAEGSCWGSNFASALKVWFSRSRRSFSHSLLRLKGF